MNKDYENFVERMGSFEDELSELISIKDLDNAMIIEHMVKALEEI